MPRLAGRLQGLAQHDIVEGAGGIGAQVGVGVALDDAEAAPDAGIHPRLAELDAAAVDLLEMHEVVEQRAVAAADVEHPRAGLDHVGDELQVDPDAVAAADDLVHRLSPPGRDARRSH